MANIFSGLALKAAKATVSSPMPSMTPKNRGITMPPTAKKPMSQNMGSFDKNTFLSRMKSGKLKAAVKSATTGA